MSRSTGHLVTSGTISWERAGADADHELLSEFLEEVAGTETIRSASSLAISRMALAPGARVLDVGCGTGVFFTALAVAVGPEGRIAGLDHGEAFLAEARARCQSDRSNTIVDLVRGNAELLPFTDATFDAAHTERVLMHLSDPDAALRELKRVVKPGGWVVCVEPDLAGMRVDFPASEHAASVVAGFCASIKNPGMGLELNRRMAEAGLTERTIDVLTDVERRYDDDTAEFFRRAAETAVERGWLSEEAAAATLEQMRRAGNEGTYISCASMFVVAGRVPPHV